MTDQPASSASDSRTAELERRIDELERRTPRRMMEESRSGLEEAFWAVMHTVFPEEARKHMRAAGREQLLAARVYIDRWIARLDEREADDRTSRERQKIEIE